MHIDDTEVRALQRKLAKVPADVVAEVFQVGKKAAQNIKDGLAEDARGSQYFGLIAEATSYDVKRKLRGVEFEIGPDRDRGGKPGRVARLANIAYFGGANGGGGTLDFDRPAKEELPRLDAHIARALGKALP